MERINRDAQYFSERLRDRLAEIVEAPVTLVEAPSGFGKTTAVREALALVEADGKEIAWINATDEPPEQFWRRFCDLLLQLDPGAGAHLTRIGYPTWVSSAEAAQVIKGIRCERETYLVIDNFHHLSKLPSTLISALLTHKYPSVHVVLIAQATPAFSAAAHVRACTLRAEDLTLSAQDVTAFAEAMGCAVTDDQAEEVYRLSEGWIAAARALLLRLAETGTVALCAATDELVDTVLWSKLGKTGREFLMSTSMFDSFTMEQAWYMMQTQPLTDDAIERLRRSPFMKEGDGGRYTVHRLLKEFALQVYRNRDEEWQQALLARAGDWCESAGAAAEAIGFFYRAGDYDAMLRQDPLRLMLEEVGGVPYDRIACDMTANTTREQKRTHFFSFLRLADTLFAAGKREQYGRLMDELFDILQHEEEGNEPLLGEWLLHAAWFDFPDIAKMGARYAEARQHISGTCLSILPDDPFLFECPSLWYLLHMQASRADKTADILEQVMDDYTLLTGGHGSGADVLYRAELAAARGQVDMAEILTYKAAFLAEHAGQHSVRFGAALAFGRIAVAKADEKGLAHAQAYLEQTQKSAMESRCAAIHMRTAELVRGMLCTMHNEPGMPAWLTRSELSGFVTVPVRFLAAYVPLTGMILGREYTRAIGYMETLLLMAKQERSHVSVMYMYLGLFLCYLGLNDIRRATENLKRALELAAPDNTLAMFVRFLPQIQPLMALPHMKEARAVVNRVKALAAAHPVEDKGAIPIDVPETLRLGRTVSEELTDREREVARFAAQGLYNKEIGEKLKVSENTVRAHLRSVFQKLGITRRSELASCLDIAEEGK